MSSAKSGPTEQGSSQQALGPFSRPREEEPLFPRGGGSILSPLEQKQIQLQAKADALFDTASGGTHTQAERPAKKKRAAPKDGVRGGGSEPNDDAVKIEDLNFKVRWLLLRAVLVGRLTTPQRLVKGSQVLGQVCDVRSLEVVVALPNSLIGYIPLSAVSRTLSTRLEAELDEHADEAGDSIEVASLFAVGQFLRVYVTSTAEERQSASGIKAKRHIELSSIPEHANSGLSPRDLVTNCTVMAAIASIEDHGYVMELGIAGSPLHGFLPRGEVDPGIAGERLQPGAVLLCLVASKKPEERIVQLTTLEGKLGNIRNAAVNATTVNTFLPGTAVDVLVSEVSSRGLAGKILGHLDATADIIHAGGTAGPSSQGKPKIGSRLRARVLCTFPAATKPKLGISTLQHISNLRSQFTVVNGMETLPLAVLSISSLVEHCVVRKVEPDVGVWADVGVEGVHAFVHISRIKDGKIEALYEASGPYKVGSAHRGRITGYNAIDGHFMASFEQRVLAQRFLRLEDVPVGAVVDGVIDKLIVKEEGVTGMIVTLSEAISGLVPQMHLADVHLQHPEKKFREGMKVKARVLSNDPAKHQLRLTLKKTLVNSEASPITTLGEATVGLRALGTIIKILPNGAAVQFYGTLRGFLPISEMSEAFIQDPKDHFKTGQVVSVHVLNVDAAAGKLVVSCKDPAAFGLDQRLAFQKVQAGDFVSAKVTQKTENDVLVELLDGGLKAGLALDHLSDKSSKRNRAAFKRIHVGQILSDLLVLDKNERGHVITLSLKSSLMDSSRQGTLLKTLDDAVPGSLASGFVRNITPTAVFVQFAGGLTGLLPKSLIPPSAHPEADFGLHKLQSLAVRVVSVDNDRLVVSMPAIGDAGPLDNKDQAPSVVNALDKSITSIQDVMIGKITKARVTSVKATQLNVLLADNIRGRIDVSELFDTWEEILDPQHPLQGFRENQILTVRILGVHDVRSHNFLPLSHRSRNGVLELTAKPSSLQGSIPPPAPALEAVSVGSQWLGFVNNHGPNHLWVTLSLTVRGRMYASDAADDLTLAHDLKANFPVGRALRVRVVGVDAERGRLTLSARSLGTADNLTWDTVAQNMVLPGRVTKVDDRQVIVELSQSISGPVQLIDVGDSYDNANTATFSKHDIVRVAVAGLDRDKKKIRLSTRPSRVLSSALPVEDPEITSSSSLDVDDILRGFVKGITDKGLFVNLGGDVTGFVRIPDLSDGYLKDWKASFRLDQLVRGRVVAVDRDLDHIRLSLKPSVVDVAYVRPLSLADLREGQVVTGRIRKVEEFGAFIVIDKSANVSGLCHRSEMAEGPVPDARKLYSEGDNVKAKILAVDLEKRRINFGLKPSYLAREIADAEGTEEAEDAPGTQALWSDDDPDSDTDAEVAGLAGISIVGTDNADATSEEGADGDVPMTELDDHVAGGLAAGPLDWSAKTAAGVAVVAVGGTRQSPTGPPTSSRKRKAATVTSGQDGTGQLDLHEPQTAADHERLLLGQPNSSSLWISYMAFQVRVGEVATAREVAERAIQTISVREETERLNVWIAFINLEVVYGSDESAEKVFRQACQSNDEQEIHERVASIYIQSGKNEVRCAAKGHSVARNVLTRGTVAESRRDVPVPGQEVRGQVPAGVDQLPAFCVLHATVARPRSCDHGTRHAIRRQGRGTLDYFEMRGHGISFAQGLSGNRAQHLRGVVGRVAQEV